MAQIFHPSMKVVSRDSVIKATLVVLYFTGHTLLLLAFTSSAAAQEPAILTADAFALGAGTVQLSYGAEYSVKDAGFVLPVYPPMPGEVRELTRLFPLSIRIGVAANVDVIVGWRGRLIARTGGDATYTDWGDPSVFTKITLTDTGRPFAAGVLFGVKIPSARYLPARLGSDAMDAWFLAASAWRFVNGEIRLNAGAAIVGDPRFTGSQDDMITGSALALWRPLTGAAFFVELYGFTGPKEEDDKLQLRGGTSLDAPFGTFSLYALGRVAGSPYDFSTAFLGTPEWGIGASLSHRFGL